MGILDSVRKVLDRIADGGLRRRPFSMLLPIRLSSTEIETSFIEEGTGQNFGLFKKVPGLLEFRWALFRTHRPEPGGSAAPTHELFLSLEFEGDVEDVLRDLADQPAIHKILLASSDFDPAKDPVDYLVRRRLRGGASSVDFHARRLGSQPIVSGRETFDTSTYDEFPFVLTSFEHPIPDEKDWVRRTSDVSQRAQLRFARKEGKVLRGAHAKTHGLIEGTFTVDDDTPEELRNGLFGCVGQKFRVWARVSNGSAEVKSDEERDLRGLALSVEIPVDSKDKTITKSDFLPTAKVSNGVGRQDFVLASAPVFFTPDIKEFARLFSIYMTTSRFKQMVRAVAYVLGSAGFGALRRVLRIFSAAPSHPLRPAFFSASPYLLGEGRPVKYSVELANPELFTDLEPTEGENFLSVVLRKSLGLRRIALRFYVHVLPDGFWSKPHAEAIENGTLDWSDLGAKPTPVATIELHEQDPTTIERRYEAETHRFSPWNALVHHQPIGNLNRARLFIYHDSARVRLPGSHQNRAPWPPLVESSRTSATNYKGGDVEATESTASAG